jgi:osmotically inducible protein OsmC
MTVERRAEVTWEGSLAEGSGRIALGTGATGELPVTWAARTETPDTQTSPEELIAAAHAACYAMSLSGILTKAGSAPERLDVTATCAFAKKEPGWRITSVDLEVRGSVPGMNGSEFEEHAQTARDACPVSNALKGNVDISVKASFI